MDSRCGNTFAIFWGYLVPSWVDRQALGLRPVAVVRLHGWGQQGSVAQPQRRRVNCSLGLSRQATTKTSGKRIVSGVMMASGEERVVCLLVDMKWVIARPQRATPALQGSW